MCVGTTVYYKQKEYLRRPFPRSYSITKKCREVYGLPYSLKIELETIYYIVQLSKLLAVSINHLRE